MVYHSKIRLLYTQDEICKSQGNDEVKLIVTTQKKMRKKSKHYRKSSNHKRERKERNEEELQKQPENNKMAINTHLSIITLSVNRLYN